jgi:hypothetical protein
VSTRGTPSRQADRDLYGVTKISSDPQAVKQRSFSKCHTDMPSGQVTLSKGPWKSPTGFARPGPGDVCVVIATEFPEIFKGKPRLQPRQWAERGQGGAGGGEGWGR